MDDARVLVHTGAAIVPAAEAAVPVLDHGFLFGDSVYEVVRTANGRPFQLAAHCARLRRSAAMIYFELAWSDAEIERRLADLFGRLGVEEAYFRIVATRGPGPISLLPDGCEQPGLYLIGRDLIRYPESMYREGCRLAVVRRLRTDPRSLDPRAKTGNYLNNMLGLIEAHRLGADDAAFLNAEEHLTECTTSNLWIVEDGVVVTPPLEEGLLQGITREWILRELPGHGVAVCEESLEQSRLERCSEAFLSGTVKGIMPVAAVDGVRLGDGPGPVTRQVTDLYADALARN